MTAWVEASASSGKILLLESKTLCHTTVYQRRAEAVPYAHKRAPLQPDARRRHGVEGPPILAPPNLALTLDAPDRRDALEGRAVNAAVRCATAALLEVRLRARAR